MFTDITESKLPESVKNGVDFGSCRQKRADQSVQIRKNKRAEQLRKRRAAGGMNTENSELVNPTDDKNTLTNGITIEPTLSELNRMLEAIKDTNPELRLAGARALRKLLSKPTDPPVDEVIDAGFVPFLRDLLSIEDNDVLVFEVAWALTNIGSSDRTVVLVDEGCVAPLVKLLQVKDASVREQAAWCIGNISGDGPKCRDMILKTPGAVDGLVKNLEFPENITTLRNVTWSVSNLCRKSDGVVAPVEMVIPLVKLLANVIEKYDDEETIVDAAWALSYISDGDEDIRYDSIIEAGVCSLMVNLLERGNNKYIHPVIRILGNIVTGTESQTQVAIDAGLLNVLAKLCKHSKSSVRKEVFWTASNVTAGSTSQIGSFLVCPNLPEFTVDAMVNEDWNVRKEAIWAICNVLTGGANEHIQCMVERFHCLSSVSDVLTCQDPKMIKVALDAIKSVLTLDSVKYGQMLDEEGGLQLIEDLQNHSDNKIYELANEIIEQFFAYDEDDDENLAPSIDINNNFTFAPNDSDKSKQFYNNEFPQEQQPSTVFGSKNANTGFNFNSSNFA